MKNLTAIAVLLLTSCSPVRRPASASSDIKGMIESFYARAQKPITSTQECVEILPAHYQQLLGLNWDEVALENYQERELSRLIGMSFDVRLTMKKQITALGEAKEDDAYECFKQTRNVFRGLRYFEDYLTEHLEGREVGKLAVANYTTLEGKAPYFLVNPKFSFNDWRDLKAGDVILSRGNAYTSAAIARIGDIDAQFSHLTMVHKEDGHLHTTEAHIEIGAVSKPFQVHLDQNNARTVVLRYRGDSVVAARASKYIYERVRNHTQNRGKNISYDFGMDYKNHDELFCSEVVYEGYEVATQGELDLPLNKTRFNPRLLRFLKQIGIGVNEDNVSEFLTFSPGDIEFDPRFEIVAEWRNPAKVGDSRQKDAVLTKMMDWMENEGYYFRPNLGMNAQSYMGFALRRVPLLNRGVREQFPLNMRPKQLKLFIVLEDVAEIMQQELIDQEKLMGRPMTFREMFEALDEFRRRDEEAYENKKKDAKFHRLFRRVD